MDIVSYKNKNMSTLNSINMNTLNFLYIECTKLLSGLNEIVQIKILVIRKS